MFSTAKVHRTKRCDIKVEDKIRIGDLMIHFLIDYENRNEYGLAGIRSLSMEDHVYILFSQNACKLDLNVISDTACSIHAIKVQPGRQSLDMHLVSCLGFLLNQYGTENVYYVISDDTDFDKVIEFWKERGYKVSRVKSIEAAVSPETAEEAGALAADNAPAKKKRTASRRTAASKAKKAAAVPSEALKTEKAGTGSETVSDKAAAAENTADVVDITLDADEGEGSAPAEAAVTVRDEALAQTAVTEAAASEEKETPEENIALPEAQGSENNEAAETSAKDAVNEAEALAKDAENETAAPAKPKRRKAPAKTKIKAEDESAQKQQPAAQKTKSQPESVAINSHIQKFLAQNKVNGTAINSIASIVAGNAGKKDRKALIYRQIIKKFGQKEGLEYYNLLKPEL